MKDNRVVLDGLVFPEGPRWHDGRLWFSDMHDRRVVATDLDGNAETVVETPRACSGLGWLPDGTLVVVSMSDRKLMRLEGGELVEHADLSGVASFHCNDMVVDRAGRAYVGNFGFDADSGAPFARATLALVEPDGAVRAAAPDMSFPNGSVITDDGTTMIVGETYASRLTAFDIAADGTLSNRRVWAKLDGGATPDGICLDAAGAVWAASPTTNEVLRVAEGGEVTARVSTGERGAYACMLGGDDRRMLLICTAHTHLAEECRALRSAQIEAVEVEVPGAGLP